ncbi:MAG: hypothetical protein UT33_C0008G0057 [Candidatus Peregrinibacteria bacterium GW2011_GWC2_39_14]|nr:MAG: hypothetical protein US92_C0004G0057 [Candidatus Peregrinibacteria bacterium GW2011_GWA2_38_36]KKR06741.1 MAG: hypothetical protein UT33_C0008G0057 [Candidatus Peregrinibacteria bacterium GW2011_GWC2_39_14]
MITYSLVFRKYLPENLYCRGGGMADAHVSGACARKSIRVQVPSPAPE